MSRLITIPSDGDLTILAPPRLGMISPVQLTVTGGKFHPSSLFALGFSEFRN
jgi:hypothetical protein